MAALEAGDLDEVGRLFDASHASLRDDYEVSCEELDVATATARAARGARRADDRRRLRRLGIAIVRASDADAVTAAIATAFEDEGFTAPVSFTVTASGPAHRDA